MYTISSTLNAPEIWGPTLPKARIDDYRKFSLMTMLKKLWPAQKKVQPSSLPPFSQGITVGERLFVNGNTYECFEPCNPSGSFLKLDVSVDKYPTNVDMEEELE